MASVTLTATTSALVSTDGIIRLLSYLPANPLPATIFPQAAGRDFLFQVRQISEKWRRMFPLLGYYQYKYFPSVQTPGDYSTPLGGGFSGGTLIDPLYNEPIPQGMTDANDDPHLSGPIGGGNPKQFHDPVPVNICLRKDVQDLELRRWGFNKVRPAFAVIPLDLLDRAGIVVSIGDEFDWGSERFEVMEYRSSGYWKNSVSTFFLILGCETVVQES